MDQIVTCKKTSEASCSRIHEQDQIEVKDGTDFPRKMPCNNTLYKSQPLSLFMEIKQGKTAWNNSPFLRIENYLLKKEKEKGISESLRGLVGIVICGEL